MDLKDVKELGHWQIAIVVAGVAFLVAAVAAKEKPLVIAAMGVVAFGIGQMKNHPLRTSVMFDNLGRVTGQITGHPRNPSPRGMSLEVIGATLLVAGLGWYIAA